MGFEPMTSSLPRRRSTPELLGPLKEKAALHFKKLERETRLELATLSLEG
jgi:hypothetical protein